MDVVDVFAHRGQFFRVLQETERSHGGDQILYVIEGDALVRLGPKEHRPGPGALVTVPAGVRHHVRNPGRAPLFFLTVYAPPAY